MRDLEIFAQAIEIDEPTKRHEFVRAACGGDENLLAKVKSLLQSYQQAGSILEHPPVHSGLAEQLASHPQSPIADPNNDTASFQPIKATELVDGTERNIGPYRLLEKIGEGGFGEVFVAEQTEPVQRKVAMKIIKPGMDSREVVARFAAERQALALMDHPNIARVFDAGTTPRGLPYFVMELVRGMNIVTYCDTVKLPIEKRLSLFIDTCRAIQHAHQKGIIHRDIKPSNVLVTLHDGEPVVKVIDFGVAKALNQRLTNMTVYTRFSFMIGTPAYMSPEQAELSGLDIDTRSDIYSLGVLLYELVTGSPPFKPDRFAKATMDEMRRIIREEEPPRPSARISTLGPAATSVAQLRSVEPVRLQSILRGDLDWIAMKALSKERSLRYETANGLATDVKRFLDGDAVLARPPSWSYLAARTIRKHRRVAVTVMVVLATIVIGAITSLVFAVWALREQAIARNSEKVALVKTDEATEALEKAEEASQQALQNLLDSKLALTNLNLKSRRPGQQTESLRAIGESIQLAKRLGNFDQNSMPLRSLTIRALSSVDLKKVRSITTSKVTSRFVSYTPDFSKMAWRERGEDGDFVTIRSVETPDRELQRLKVPFNTQTAYHDELITSLSPNGRFMTMGTLQHGCILWDLETGKQLRELRAYYPIGGLQFSGDGEYLGIIERGPDNTSDRVNIYGLKNNQLEKSIEMPAVRQISISPDGQRIALGGQNALWICDVETGKKVAEVSRDYGVWGAALAWSRSGELLAATLDNQIQVWEVAELTDHFANRSTSAKIGSSSRTKPAPICTLTGHEALVDSLVFHPKLEFLLVSSSWDDTTRLWNVFSGFEQIMVPNSKPSISQDGRLISVSSTNGVDLFEILAGDACQWIWRGNTNQVIIEPEGKWVAAGTASGIRFWSLPNLNPIGRIGERDKDGIQLGIAWDESKHGLLMGNSLGVFEVPAVGGDGGKLQLGPARQILTTSFSAFVAIQSSLDGRWILAHEMDDWEPILLDREHQLPQRMHRSSRTQSVAFSPNAQWLASFVNTKILIWDLNLNREVATMDSPAGVSQHGLAFSKDSRYLIVSASDRMQWISTADWSVTDTIDDCNLISVPAIASNDDLVAIPLSPGELGLLRRGSQPIVANLGYPDPPRMFYIARFSEDGSYLLVSHGKSVTVWKLGMIRERLVELGLDWNSPTISPRGPTQSLTQIEFEKGELAPVESLIEKQESLPRHQLAEAVKEMFDAGHDFPDLHYHYGWSLEALGDYGPACESLKRATDMAPYAESWRMDYANCLLQSFRFAEAWQAYWPMASPEQSRQSVFCFQQLCYLAATRPEIIPNVSEFSQLLDSWHSALSGKNSQSAFDITVSGLTEESKQTLWEAVGMALFGLKESERSLDILKKYARDGRSEGNSVLACIHADLGNIEEAQKHLAIALSIPARQAKSWFGRLALHFYDGLNERAQKKIEAMRAVTTVDTSDRSADGTIDSHALAHCATVNFGRLFLHPSSSTPEVDRTLEGNVVWWDLFQPDHEIRFDLPVPQFGKYRLTADFVGSYYCGQFQVVRQNEDAVDLQEVIDLYWTRKQATDPALFLIEKFDLGEFEAVPRMKKPSPELTSESEEATEPAEGNSIANWTIPLVLRSTGRHEKSVQYSLLIDKIHWVHKTDESK